MKLQSRFAGWLCIFLLSTLTATAAGYETVSLGKHKAVANRVLARFKPTTAAAARVDILQRHDVKITRSYSSVSDLVVLDLPPSPKLNTLIPSDRDPVAEGKHLMARIKELMLTGAFSYVEPNYIVKASLEPTDGAYVDGTLWGLPDIGAPEAWDITTGSTGVIVAVIDSGVNYLHQDLAGQMWINPGEIPGNGIDDDGDGYVDNIHGINAITNSGDPMDDNRHGTHVAGTIGASANDAGNHVGVAWNVRIMALKFLDSEGSGSLDDAVQCIDFAYQNGAHILNNSWGGGPYTQALFDVIQATRDAGKLFVVAAGNGGIDGIGDNNDAEPTFPASYNVDSIIVVAAIDVNGNLPSFSNYGRQSVHIGAPGVGIYSTLHSSPAAYGNLSGTSMASPHVAGAAALLWAQLQPTTVTEVAELRQRILLGATPTPSLTGKTATGGRLNVANSLGVNPDGVLELSTTSDSGLTVIAGRPANVFVRVKDLFPVNNATVGGTLSFGGGNVVFVNNGVAPDAVAGDNIYSATINVPAAVQPFTLTLDVTAPNKTATNEAVVFTVIPAPSNDSFVGREVIASTPAIHTGSNRLATEEPGEPIHLNRGGGKTLWWTWTAPAGGVYTLSTDGSSFDTVLAIYTGNSLGSLSFVTGNDDAGFDWTSTAVFPATAGTAYHFVVDGFYDSNNDIADAGGIQLNFSSNAPMLNNNFVNRAAISGVNVTVNGHNVGATTEAGEPNHAGLLPQRSVWWTWTAPSSGNVTISTAGSSFDTVLAVYTGQTLGSLAQIAAGDDVTSDTLTSEATFFAQAGVAYQIAVAGFGEGNVQLHLGRTPVNDNFAGRLPLTGDLVEATAMTLGASFENGEPLYSPGFGRSVWWTWTAPRSGKATVTTDGSNFDTVLSVYTGNSLGDLTLIADNDDRVYLKIRTSLVNFGAVVGTTYHFQVDGFEGLAGLAALTLTMDGRSQLALPELRADGASIELLGEPERIYILKAASDLSNWNAVATNAVISRRVLFRDTTVAGSRFYRAEPISLLEGD